MRVKKYLEQVAYISTMDLCGEKNEVYFSKFDDSYITRVGMEKSVKFLAEREVTEQLTHGVGFSPKYNEWYGWSHRAIFGFKIGSTCKKGDCTYGAANIEEEIKAAILFWSYQSTPKKLNTTATIIENQVDNDGNPIGQLLIKWTYGDHIGNKQLRGKIGSVTWNYDLNFGRGEWTAETMEDAKQMAIDFNEGVS